MTQLLEGLNTQQQKAVQTTDGPLLILAGAGSGKTRTIITRIAYILEQRLAYPDQILAITFTNKAAGEMKERIAGMGIAGSERIWMSTFHAACARILRQFADRLGYTKRFKILDAADQKQLMKAIIKNQELNPKEYVPAKIISKISRAKNDKKSPDDLRQEAKSKEGRITAQLYARYNEELRRSDSMDFDDLILNANRLIRSDEEVRNYLQNKFKYILVDEFQDTNRPQNEFVKLIGAKNANVCVCGDEDQSIYGWRGAQVENILNFTYEWPDAQIVRLEQNYRSTSTILNCANAVIKNNKNRLNKKLWTENGESDAKLQVIDSESPITEASFIADKVSELLSRGYRYGDLAVLYRANYQSRSIENAFVNAGIPYKTIGSLNFYQRAEVKDMLSYLALIESNKDDVAFERIVNQPKRGLGPAAIEKLREFAEFKGWGLYETVQNLEDVPTLTNAQKNKFKRFRNIIETARDSSDTITGRLETLFEQSGYADYLSSEKVENGQSRLDNIRELITGAEQFDLEHPGAGLTGFLEHAALTSSTDETSEEGQVSLMTLHSAKGLEYPVVFMTGMVEDVFPSGLSISEGNEEEERRLCYVGITRAMEELYLCSYQTRFAGRDYYSCEPSRFINELPEELVEFKNYDRFGGLSDGEKRPTFRSGLGFNKEMLLENGQVGDKRSAGLKTGDLVFHKNFGKGVVTQYRSKKDMAVVVFPENGVKTMKGSYLTKL